MKNIIIEMETKDPDDFITLVWALSHPNLNVKAILINPGEPLQVGIVQYALKRLGKEGIPVGSYDFWNKNKRKSNPVSDWHFKNIDILDTVPGHEEVYGPDLLRDVIDEQDFIFIGSPPRNTSEYFKNANAKLPQKMFIQGGFAGDSLVAKENRLPKFDGKESCVTYNLCKNKNATDIVLQTNCETRLVSKNVCHGMIYDIEMHEMLRERKSGNLGLSWIWDLMDRSYIESSVDKAFHDPFALCALVDEGIVEWREIGYYYDAGAFRSYGVDGSNIWISVAGNKDRFREIFCS